MNPNREGTQSNFELPPQPEPLEGENRRQEKGQQGPASQPEQTGKQPKTPALPAVPDDIPVADTPAIGLPADDTGQAPASFSHQANDSDHIEPAWLNKAKAVISQTHNDPYEQKVQMSRVKAEYIQKRFNKEVKSDEH